MSHASNGTGAVHPFDPAREDQRLIVGSRVRVRWSHGGYLYDALATIVSLDLLSAEVQLLSPISAHRDRPGFSTLTVPRFTNSLEWSSRHCLLLERG